MVALVSRLFRMPDLVWELGGRLAAVVDAKYKQEKSAGYPDADLYQMLAYCTALHLPRGHLVYARGNAEAGTPDGHGSSMPSGSHTLGW